MKTVLRYPVREEEPNDRDSPRQAFLDSKHILGDHSADGNRILWDHRSMLRSLVSHFRGEPICVGCEEHPVVSDYLCEYCLSKLADFLAEKDKESEPS